MVFVIPKLHCAITETNEGVFFSLGKDLTAANVLEVIFGTQSETEVLPMTWFSMKVADLVLVVGLLPPGVFCHSFGLIRNRFKQRIKLCAFDLVIK